MLYLPTILKSIILATIVIAGIFGSGVTASALSNGGGPLPTNLAFATKDTACQTLSTLDTSQDCGTGHGNKVVESILSAVVNILSIVVGAVAVIVIIISGFRYITSGGDSNSVTSAKRGLIYALVGLAIAVLAQFLVHFVLFHAAKQK